MKCFHLMETMMRAAVLTTIALGGCVSLALGCNGGEPAEVNPVVNCAFFPETDCCENSRQCFNYYGAESGLVYCSRPKQKHGGICSECLEDADCVGSDDACYIAEDGYGQCLDPNACYEGTPAPWLTSCR